MDFSVIHIKTENRTDAYRLFQVLNDRGMSLTEGDLLRSTTLELLGDTRWRNQQSSAEHCWDQILSAPPNVTEAYLRAYFSSVCGKRPGKTTLLDEFLDKFFPQRNTPPSSAAEADAIVTTIRTIHSEAERYILLMEGEWPYVDDTTTTQWEKDRLRLLVVELKHTNCIPLLLAACKLSAQDFAKMVQYVERFAFRYKIICNAHMTPLQTVYYTQAVAIRANPAAYRVATLQAALRGLMGRASDALFETHLMQQIYSRAGGNKPIKYLLLNTEYYWSWFSAGAQGEPKCLDQSVVHDFSNTTIEHVYPQSATGPRKVQALESLKNTLGNLTVMGAGPNGLADDRDFASKKIIFEQSSLQINRRMAQNVQWASAEIDAWQAKIIEVAKKVYVV